MLNIGLVGTGIIAPIHKEAIELYDGATIHGIYDIDPKQYDTFQIDSSYIKYSTYESMIQDEQIDIIHILTPHHTHYELTKAALQHKKHVLVEKPFTLELIHAYELIELAKTNNCKLSVCFQHRTDNTTTFIQDIIKQNTYGKLQGMKGFVHWYRGLPYYQQADWRGKWKTEGGGSLINQAIHTLDLLHYLNGEVKEVVGEIMNLDHPYIEVEDNSHLLLTFKNGVKGLFNSSNSVKHKGGIQLEYHFEETSFYQFDETLYQMRNNKLEVVVENKARTGVKSYFGSGHEYLISDFYDAVLNNNDQYIQAKDTINVLKTLDMIYKTSR